MMMGMMSRPTVPPRGSLLTFRWNISLILCLLSIILCFGGIAAVQEGEETNESDVSRREFRVEHGLVVLASLKDVQQAVAQFKSDTNASSAIMLLLIYSKSCPHSQDLVERTQEAQRLVQHYFETTSDAVRHAKPPLFGKLEGTNVEEDTWKALGITSYPTLVFVAGSNNNDDDDTNNTILLESIGARDTAESIMRTVLHYYYHFVVILGSIELTDDFINVKPKVFDSINQVQNFIRQHRQALLEYSIVEPALPPHMALEEKEYIQWLLMKEEDDDQSDGFVLVVQCHDQENPSEQQEALLQAFDEMARNVTNRRDCLFVRVSTCDSLGDGGDVTAWRIPLDFDFVDWSLVVKYDFVASSDSQQQQMVHFIINVCTPSILWFDRRTTAPIAFPKYRKVHAVLFVDLHRTSTTPDAVEQRNVLRRFRRECRAHRQAARNVLEQDMVCLIVPSTETRVLTTFGIDIWTPLDESVLDPQANTQQQQVLPTLLITDQRYGGTRRFYLDRKDLVGSDDAIANFVGDFWSGRLKPQFKSSDSKTRVLDSGIRIVSAETLGKELLQDSKHALIFFTSPTCGHCKRFSVLYNQLASVLEHVKWDSFLALYQMDVTTNDVLDFNMTVRWVPDLYYMSPNNRDHPVRFDWKDELGDEVGRLNNHMHIIAWLLHVGDFEDSQLKQLLSELKEKF